MDVNDQCKIVMKSLEILIFLTREQEFADFFKREGLNLYLQIVLPFLNITEQEREQMVADPQEFCHLIEDVCDQQKSSTVKALAAKLLINLSE